MKNRLYLLLIILLVLPFLGTAVPKYTNKKNAITLALAIEKANYNGTVILAAYAMNRKNDYYVAVTLSNGRTERWYISDIYRFSRDGLLNLRGNKVIVFPNANSDSFDILNKNLFHRIALKATAIKQIYSDFENPMAGQSLLYKIKEFYLIPPGDKSYGKDPFGYPYRYKVNTYNCENVLLSNRDVLEYLNNRQFLTGTSALDTRPLAQEYTVKSITGFNKTTDKIYSQFGVLITFDRAIDLVPENFPVIIRETGAGRKDGSRDKQYIVDVILPNTLTKRVIRLDGKLRQSQLEYLRDVKVITDRSKKCRSILRASFNYEIMDVPPYVTKIDSDKIYVTFFNITDQSVSEPPVTLADAEALAKERKKWLEISPSIQVNSDFGRYYSQAISVINEGFYDKDYDSSVEKLKTGVELLEKAALLVNEDAQLLEILNSRNTVRERIVFISMDNATNELHEESPNTGKIKQYLDNAYEYSDSNEQMKKIDSIKQHARL